MRHHGILLCALLALEGTPKSVFAERLGLNRVQMSRLLLAKRFNPERQRLIAGLLGLPLDVWRCKLPTLPELVDLLPKEQTV